MSNTILIIGEPATGKSTAIRNLNPKETFIINVIDKPMPFPGAVNNYTLIKNKGSEGNYFSTNNHSTINSIIKKISNDRMDIKNLIIDDFQYVMSIEFINRAAEKGYDKFSELAQHALSIIKELSAARKDLNCFVMSHSVCDENGKHKLKTLGKMLENIVTLDGMFWIVLHSVMQDEKYKFLTHNSEKYLARSPMGMFDDRVIDNDLSFVTDRIKGYLENDRDKSV